MKRRFTMTIVLEYEKPGCDGSGAELRDEMHALECAVEAAVITRAGRQQSASVQVSVMHGESGDV